MSGLNDTSVRGTNANEILPNPDGSINVIVLSGDETPIPDQKFDGVVAPGEEEDLIEWTIPEGKQVKFTQLCLACRFEGDFSIFKGDDKIGSGRTGPASQNPRFQWVPFHPAVGGDVIRVRFTLSGYRPSTNVEAYLHGIIK